MKYYILYVFVILQFSSSCFETTDDEVNKDDKKIAFMLESSLENSLRFLGNRDLDGDGIFDKINFEYSGGAHCCYKLNIFLTSLDSIFEFPFEMDGGYEFQIVDGSQPDHFYIKDYDNDSLEEIYMEIETYNGIPNPIDKSLTEQYGIKTNYIIIDFEKGNLSIKDFQK